MNMRQIRTEAVPRALLAAALAVSLWSGVAVAQTGDGGTQPILQEGGVSARAFALGRAYTALADDASGMYWNPAGLEYVPRMAFSFFHMPLIVEGASYDFIGFAYPTLSFGTVGLGYSRAGAGDISTTDIDGRLLS